MNGFKGIVRGKKDTPSEAKQLMLAEISLKSEIAKDSDPRIINCCGASTALYPLRVLRVKTYSD